MAIKKAKESMTTIGLKTSTKERFNNLVKQLNEDNRSVYGERALKITCDDVLNELITKYPSKDE